MSPQTLENGNEIIPDKTFLVSAQGIQKYTFLKIKAYFA